MGGNHLAFAGDLVGISGGTIELNDEGYLISEVGGGKVIAIDGPLTMDFNEAHLEEGRGSSR